MAVTKVINSESKQYKPVLVDSLVLDAAPTVGSLNGVTSDGVAKAISGSGSVPTPTADDDGKVLTANDGSFGWSDPTGGTEYTAGTGITISEENAIAVTEAISNGAAAGATAVQPAALNDYALSSSLATVATSGSYADLSNKPSIPAAQVNSDWNAVSGVSQILNKPSLATVATTGAYSDLSGTPTIPTVDQSYNASSTNAQSGTAVAQAIAAIPSASYTAGDGIDITANAVSVKAGTGLEFDDVSETVQQNLTCSGIYEFNSAYHAWDICPLTQDIYDAMNTTGGFTLTLSKELGAWMNGFYLALATAPDQYRSYSHSSGYAIIGNKINASAGTTVSYGFPAGTSFTFKLSDYNSSKSNRTLEQVAASISSYHVVVILDSSDEFIVSDVPLAGNNPEVIATCESTTTITDALCVSNPLPASTSADENKVLTVNSSGNAEWATPATPSVDEVPDVGSSDDGKVLTASYSGGVGSYSWQTAQGGGSSEPAPLAQPESGYNAVRIKFDNAAYNPSTSLSSIGTWTQVDTGKNIWDCVCGTTDALFSQQLTVTNLGGKAHILDAYLRLPLNSNDAYNYFYGCDAIEDAYIQLLATGNNTVYNLTGAFNGCSNLKTLFMDRKTSVDRPCFVIKQICKNCFNLIDFGYKQYATSSFTPTDMLIGDKCSEAFYNCYRLVNVWGLDCFSSYNQTRDITYMFYQCYSLKNLSFYALSAATATSAFEWCRSLADVPTVNLYGNCNNMFKYCFNLSVHRINFLTSTTINATSMFESSGVISVPISGSSRVTTMASMFKNCNSLMQLPDIDYSNVTNVSNMFSGADVVNDDVYALYQSISALSNITSHTDCFKNCGSSTTTGASELAQIPASWGGTGS